MEIVVSIEFVRNVYSLAVLIRVCPISVTLVEILMTNQTLVPNPNELFVREEYPPAPREC